MEPHFALNIRQILQTPVGRDSEQIIIDGNGLVRRYSEFHDRIGRLGSALADLGLGVGSTVAVMDWDTPRYLECFFAIPMIGATLHTVNIRLSPEQILFTINHAEDDAIFCHEDFLTILLPLLPRLMRPVTLVLLTDRSDAPQPEGFVGEYEALLGAQPSAFAFRNLPEETRATLFYTTGTTGELSVVE
jgi:fatty-acyl-CoA synthase